MKMEEKMLDEDLQQIEREVEKEEGLEQKRKERKDKFSCLSVKSLAETLSLTIKEDHINKIVTFLCFLSAYTENNQFNISFNAPSSSGKSYIPTQIASLFPKEDVIKVGYCSPTAFFHDKGQFNKETGEYFVNLERKILIFLDQPHTLLLQHLRPFLSHDEKELHIKITDKSKKYGLKTKTVVLRGFPSVVFCTAGLRIDEQEATRFLLLSPETSQGKLKQGIAEAMEKEMDSDKYRQRLKDNPERRLLKERIEAIKEERIGGIKINNEEKIKEWFFKRHKVLKPRHQRDVRRLLSIIKSISLLNIWHRGLMDEDTIKTSDQDLEEGFKLWSIISRSQELNIPPYIYRLFEEVLLPGYKEKGEGLTRNEIVYKHSKVYGRPIPEWQLRRDVIPMLESAGLVSQETHPDDKRKKIVIPIDYSPDNQSSEFVERITEEFEGKIV